MSGNFWRCAIDARGGRRLLVARGDEVRTALEGGAHQAVFGGVGERRGRREGEDLGVDLELRNQAAHADEEREAHPGLPQRQHRVVERLIRFELLRLDAREVSLVDGAAAVTRLKELERLLVGVDDLFRETIREHRLRDLQIGGLHLKLEGALRVDPREPRGRQRVARGLEPQAALAGERVFERGRVGEADRPVVRRAPRAARIVVERPAVAAVDDRIGHGPGDAHVSLGRLHGRLGNEQVETAGAENLQGVGHRQHRREFGGCRNLAVGPGFTNRPEPAHDATHPEREAREQKLRGSRRLSRHGSARP